jgi:CRP-like cAMP-binding protein
MQSASHLIVGSAEFSSSTNPGPGGGGQTRPAANRHLRLVHSADPKRREERLLSDLLAHLPALRPLFEGLAEEKALAVENALEWVDLPAGSALFTIGDVAPDAFVLTAGRLAVKVGSDSQARTVASIHPGEIVGEMALLGAEPRSATIMAEHDNHLIRLSREAFTVLLDSAPEARHYLFGVLTSRLRHTSLGSHPKHDAAETIAIIPLGSPEPVRKRLTGSLAECRRLGIAWAGAVAVPATVSTEAQWATVARLAIGAARGVTAAIRRSMEDTRTGRGIRLRGTEPRKGTKFVGSQALSAD